MKADKSEMKQKKIFRSILTSHQNLEFVCKHIRQQLPLTLEKYMRISVIHKLLSLDAALFCLAQATRRFIVCWWLKIVLKPSGQLQRADDLMENYSPLNGHSGCSWAQKVSRIEPFEGKGSWWESFWRVELAVFCEVEENFLIEFNATWRLDP